MPDVVDHAVPMPTETTVLRIAPDDFARRFSLRARNLMWFLGAGASASAGLPTAIDMIWEFKQKLFVSQRRGSLQTVSDLSHPIVRARLQAHIDSLGLPPSGVPDEYGRPVRGGVPSRVGPTEVSGRKTDRRQGRPTVTWHLQSLCTPG